MIVVDVETTGLNPDQHSLVSIGAIDFNDPEWQFYQECRIWDGAKIEERALEVNGFTRQEIEDTEKQTEGELVTAFLEWAYDSPEHTIAGQNVYVDLEFIRAAARRAGKSAALPHRIIDQHSICFAHMIQHGTMPPSENGKTTLNSDAVMEYVGIPVEPRPHNALNGATWEAEAFSRLLYDKSLFEQFFEFTVPWLEEKGEIA